MKPLHYCVCVGTRLSAAVHEILLPIMKEIKNDLNSVKHDLNSVKNDLSSFNETVSHLNKTVSSLSGDLEDYKQQTASQLINQTEQLEQIYVEKLDSKLDSVNASMREYLRAIKGQLEEHQTQTSSELAGLNTSLLSNTRQLTRLSIDVDALDSKLDSVNASTREELRAIESQLEEHQTETAGLHSFLQSNNFTEDLTEISTKMDTLDSKLDSVNNSDILIREDLSCIKEDLSSLNETMNRISEDVEEHDNHTTTELMKFFTCGGVGWRRVVYLDMTDPNTNCPSGWQLLSGLPHRVCGRTTAGTGPIHSCDSVTFTVTGGEYSKVCGQIRSYQHGETDGFETFNTQGVTSIDRAYISGVSLTHGSPRQHIWSFVAGRSEHERTLPDACPCDATIVINTPPFIGNDYFCESGVNSGSISGFHANDPLWDGGNCISNSTCCSFNNPPYFTKDVNTTTDDLEVRICTWNFLEDTPIELIELYVQ